jgi:hypothetical protein
MLSQVTDRAAAPPDAQPAPEAGRGPLIARLAVSGAVGVLLLAAVYLIAMRGEALLVDLAKLGALCF